MTPDELTQLIAAPGETRRVELKAAMPWSEVATRAKVAKAALALANTEDGGVLIFGFAESQSGFQPLGVSPADAAAFNTDDVQAHVNAHAAPPVSLTVTLVESGGLSYVAVIVREFSDYPAICTRNVQLQHDKGLVLRKGAIYCRSRVKNETIEIQSPDDLRDLIRLATRKEMHRYFELRAAERATGDGDPARFAEELRSWAL